MIGLSHESQCFSMRCNKDPIFQYSIFPSFQLWAKRTKFVNDQGLTPSPRLKWSVWIPGRAVEHHRLGYSWALQIGLLHRFLPLWLLVNRDVMWWACRQQQTEEKKDMHIWRRLHDSAARWSRGVQFPARHRVRNFRPARWNGYMRLRKSTDNIHMPVHMPGNPGWNPVKKMIKN